MHILMMVTYTDQDPVDLQMAPFDIENEDVMENCVEYEGSEKGVKDWLECHKNLLETYSKMNDEDVPHWGQMTKDEIERVEQASTLMEKLKLIAEIEEYDLDENNNVVSKWNPLATWDWYTVGGRWNNWLVTKKGVKCNSCKVGEVDWEGMRRAQMEKAEEEYNDELLKARLHHRKPLFYPYENHIPTLEEYVSRVDKPVAPYGVLHEGEWLTEEDGRWQENKITEAQTEKSWAEWFHDWSKTLNPETEVTIVDCHI